MHSRDADWSTSQASAGTDPADTFLDLALEDDLNLLYLVDLFNGDESRMPEIVTNPNITIGLSDGGAHVDVLCDAGYCTYWIGKWVREHQVLSLEQAIKRITTEPADLFGNQTTRPTRAWPRRQIWRSSTSRRSGPPCMVRW